MSDKPKREAITRIEGLVVLTISGLAIGVLLVGIIKVREAAARAQCQGNLKQIGLAAHNYASAHKYLPPGWLGPLPTTTVEASPTTEMQAISCLCLLLPFFEQHKLYAQLVASAPAEDYFDAKTTYPAWYNLPPGPSGNSMSSLATTRIRSFVCPSDAAQLRTNGCILWQWGPISAAENGVPQNFNIDTSSQNALLGRTNFVGIGGVDQNYYQKDQPNAKDAPGSIWAKFDGLMTNRSQLTLEEIHAADGTANTFMFGEVLGDSDGPTSQQVGYSVSWMCGSYPTYSGLPTGGSPFPAGSASCYWTFGSRHADVVQFSMGDGAVRQVKKGVPPFDTNNYLVPANPKCMFGNYAGWHEGLLIDPAFIGN